MRGSGVCGTAKGQRGPAGVGCRTCVACVTTAQMSFRHGSRAAMQPCRPVAGAGAAESARQISSDVIVDRAGQGAPARHAPASRGVTSLPCLRFLPPPGWEGATTSSPPCFDTHATANTTPEHKLHQPSPYHSTALHAASCKSLFRTVRHVEMIVARRVFPPS